MRGPLLACEPGGRSTLRPYAGHGRMRRRRVATIVAITIASTATARMRSATIPSRPRSRALAEPAPVLGAVGVSGPVAAVPCRAGVTMAWAGEVAAGLGG